VYLWNTQIELAESEEWMWDNLYPHQRFVLESTGKPVVPKEYYDFIRSGRSMKEIEDYLCIIRYGMLHGKKEILIII
jgi:hypothetical protein